MFEAQCKFEVKIGCDGTYRPWIISNSWWFTSQMISFSCSFLDEDLVQFWLSQTSLKPFAWKISLAQIKLARFSSLFNLVITWGGYLTPHVGMLNRASNLKEVTLTNVGNSVGFIHSPSFHKWSHLHVA